MPRRASSVPVVSSSGGQRRGLIAGRSEQFNRYKILKRQQKRIQQNRIAVGLRTNSGEISSNSDNSLDTDPDLEIQKVVNHVRRLANDLYLPLKEKNLTNLVYSPLGFCISAVMLKLACRGISKKELYQALAFEDLSDSEMTIGFSALLNELQKSSSFILKQGNKMYIQQSENQQIKQSYKNRIKAIYDGVSLEEIDFQNEETSSIINKWCHSTAGKMLGDILTRRINNNRLILVNPIYFTGGDWLHSFDPKLTQDMRFFTDSKNFVDVKMMRSGKLKNLLYFSMNKLRCRVIVLPFKGDHLCFVIFLPDDKGGLPTIETGLENISPAHYFKDMNEFRKKMSRRSVFEVFLPKFQIDRTIDFAGPMKELGVETAFQIGKADFSGMVDESMAKKLSLGQILQKVKFVVDEYGSAKSPKASNDMRKDVSSTKPEKSNDNTTFLQTQSDDESLRGDCEVTEFRVDHPFYFQVVDMKSDLILLAGSCTNPLKGSELEWKEFMEKYDIRKDPNPNPKPSGCIKSWGTFDK